MLRRVNVDVETWQAYSIGKSATAVSLRADMTRMGYKISSLSSIHSLLEALNYEHNSTDG